MKFSYALRFTVVLTGAWIASSFVMVGIVAAFPGEPRGFDGFNWGIAREGLGRTRCVGKDASGMMVFERQDEEGRFGSAKIAAIEYGFRDGRLVAVRIKVDSLLQYLLLKDEATKRYGTGGEMPGRTDSYIWSGGQTEITLVGSFTES